MSCYNCGYDTSVVCKDDNGWLCEWCSDTDNQGQTKHKQQIIELKSKAETLDYLKIQYKELNEKHFNELIDNILGDTND